MQTKLRHKEELEGGYKAFTLVELIVVITILAILGTISFITFQGFSADARDAKRITDVKSLLSKINIETTKGVSLEYLIKDKTETGITINGNSGVITNIGIINFENLKENRESFQDPLNKEDYKFAFAEGATNVNGESENYRFMQMATINERGGTSQLVGNYYEMQSGDSPSLFVNKDGTPIRSGLPPMIYNPGIVVKKEPPISPPISPPIGGYTLIVTGGTPSSATQNSETTLLVTATIGTSYTVSYNVNGGGSATPGNSVSTAPFSSWSLSGGGSVGPTSTPTTTYTFGTSNGSLTANYGNQPSITLPAASTRSGYTFDGWWTSGNGGEKRGDAGDTYIPTQSETLYAGWIGYKLGTSSTFSGCSGRDIEIYMLNKITTMASCNQSSGSPQSSWNNTLSIGNKPKEYFYNFYNPDSLCPSPWRIPSSDEWREIIKLFTGLYTSSGIGAPFNLPLAGGGDGGGHDNGTAGNYWARDGASSRDNVRIYSTSANVSSNYNSSRELSVRCIK